MKADVEEGIPLVGALSRTQAAMKGKLSTRARAILGYIVEADHLRRRHVHILGAGLTEVELLRRAAKVEPPLSFEALRTRYRNCGRVTATEICEALGLPTQKFSGRAQCPRCGHIFGGGK